MKSRQPAKNRPAAADATLAEANVGLLLYASTGDTHFRRRKWAEKQLGQQESFLREQGQVLDLAQLLATDLGGRIVLWTRGAQALYGWSKAEVLSRSADEFLQTAFSQPPETIKSALFSTGAWEGE